jgi:hypothetical protein
MDLLLINVPSVSLVYPPAATSLLKGVVENAGYTASVRDYNLHLFSPIKNDTNLFTQVSNYFTIGSTRLEATTQSIIDNFYDYCVEDIVKLNPKFLGISVFTFECQRATEELLKKLKPVYNGKVIIGGAGLSTTGIAAEGNDFGTKLKELGLTDFYIRGEGEDPLIEILNDNTVNVMGVNNDNYKQLDNLDALPFPNYDDVINLEYDYAVDQIQLPITTSRGCVRKCTFCDIHAFWKKFKYRSGENVAEEMIFHYKKYGVTNFFFTDSLINGSRRSFAGLAETLLKYYKDNGLPERFFVWGGQFIVRSEEKMPPYVFKLAARSGLNGLAMGVESLSEKVRDHMKKGFSNKDLDYTVEQMRVNNINGYFLMIAGYPTESEDDFNESLEMFTKYQGYAVDGTIFGVNLGGTLSIDDGTPLHINAHDLGLDLTPQTIDGAQVIGLDWVNQNNPELDLLTRCKRRVILQELLMDLGFTVWNGDHQLLRLKESYEKLMGNTANS